jgi:hypothetical protein
MNTASITNHILHTCRDLHWPEYWKYIAIGFPLDDFQGHLYNAVDTLAEVPTEYYIRLVPFLSGESIGATLDLGKDIINSFLYGPYTHIDLDRERWKQEFIRVFIIYCLVRHIELLYDIEETLYNILAPESCKPGDLKQLMLPLLRDMGVVQKTYFYYPAAYAFYKKVCLIGAQLFLQHDHVFECPAGNNISEVMQGYYYDRCKYDRCKRVLHLIYATSPVGYFERIQPILFDESLPINNILEWATTACATDRNWKVSFNDQLTAQVLSGDTLAIIINHLLKAVLQYYCDGEVEMFYNALLSPLAEVTSQDRTPGLYGIWDGSQPYGEAVENSDEAANSGYFTEGHYPYNLGP